MDAKQAKMDFAVMRKGEPMSDIQIFPETVDEFMEHYKVVDKEQVYTNGIELIPIFRMKQWFEHLEQMPPAQPDCSDCIEHGGDWDCDHVHCHKGKSAQPMCGAKMG